MVFLFLLQNYRMPEQQYQRVFIRLLQIYLIRAFKLGAVADFRVGHVFVADIKSGLAFNGSLWDSGEVKREEGGFVMPNSVIPDGKGGWTPNTTVKTGGNNYATAISYFSTKYATYGELLADGRAFKIREISFSYSLSKIL